MRNQLPKTTAQKTPEIQTNRAKPQKQTKQPKKQPQPQLLRQKAAGKAARETVQQPAGNRPEAPPVPWERFPTPGSTCAF